MIKTLKVKIKEPQKKFISIHTEFIKLDAAMKLGDAVGSGGLAKKIIEDGCVKVNGEICTVKGKKLVPGDSFLFDNILYIIKSQNDN